MKELNEDTVCIYPDNRWCYTSEIEQTMIEYGLGDDYYIGNQSDITADAEYIGV